MYSIVSAISYSEHSHQRPGLMGAYNLLDEYRGFCHIKELRRLVKSADSVPFNDSRSRPGRLGGYYLPGTISANFQMREIMALDFK